MKVKDMSLADGVKQNLKPRTIDGHSLQIYLEYVVFILTTDSNDKISEDDIQALIVDISGFDLILGRPWLHNVPFIIHWETEYWAH